VGSVSGREGMAGHEEGVTWFAQGTCFPRRRACPGSADPVTDPPLGLEKYPIAGIYSSRIRPDDYAMGCTLCGGWLERCASCARTACDTAICSRCREAVPDAHPALVPAGLAGTPSRIVYVA